MTTMAVKAAKIAKAMKAANIEIANAYALGGRPVYR